MTADAAETDGERRRREYLSARDRDCECGAQLLNELRDVKVAGSLTKSWRAVCDRCGYVSVLFEPLVRFRYRHPVEVRDAAIVRARGIPSP